MEMTKAKALNTGIVLGFYVVMALFSTTAFVNEITSGMVLDSIATLR